MSVPGFQELLVIGVITLLVFGPDRLPELARTAGRLLGRLRHETQRNVDDLRRVAEIQDLQQELRSLREELTGAGEDVARRVRSAAGEPPGRPGPGHRARRREDDPPPTDPEAT